MATPFLSSEEFDERAHRLYNEGDYDGALEVLKEGLVRYPHAVDLLVGLGYTRLAREEFFWAKQAFDRALALEPENDDAMVGLGEVLLRIGRRDEALELFETVRRGGCGDDLELLLSMGRALYREQLFEEALEVFNDAVMYHPESAEALAAAAYALHRTGEEMAARRELLRALKLDPKLHEARIYLGHLLYDRGDWKGAARQFEQVPPAEHWDTLALWRLLEVKRALEGLETGDPSLAPWEARLEELAAVTDPIDDLLAELERGIWDEPGFQEVAPPQDGARHRVRTVDGRVFAGDWLEIVQQLRDVWGQPDETVAQFMRREADERRAKTGIGIPFDDPEAFLRASARAGFLRIDY